ncbi:hypothetical protein THMIRHAM_14450 [Thiomicrorhabdus immobilis]|uniref:Uncharacterized protein n=1 Tax=Thiomicrorhabdus immobilis TaxID=2791037 RepID=A0ABN6D0K6_9GAMM|nr:hypothetical protein [Thiomicrorhabdus immobilis]BCN93660.1 hypothetical protein THMIRHAM_14450 [Thiomicrorhabdus immobilis]
MGSLLQFELFEQKDVVVKQPKGAGVNEVKQATPHSAGNLYRFREKEIDMMPGQWAEVGDPTPYELRLTIQTCKRLWYENKAALQCIDCDREKTLHNIKRLEKLYIHLMDYLSGD